MPLACKLKKKKRFRRGPMSFRAGKKEKSYVVFEPILYFPHRLFPFIHHQREQAMTGHGTKVFPRVYCRVVCMEMSTREGVHAWFFVSILLKRFYSLRTIIVEHAEVVEKCKP